MYRLLINKNVVKILCIVLISGFCFFPVYEVSAGDCVETFSWQPNSESDLAGYKIYYGQTNNGPYPGVVNVGTTIGDDDRVHGTVTGLDCGQTYYFVCVAVNNADLESEYSQQTTITTSSVVPGPPTNLNIIE